MPGLHSSEGVWVRGRRRVFWMSSMHTCCTCTSAYKRASVTYVLRRRRRRRRRRRGRRRRILLGVYYNRPNIAEAAR